MDTQQFSAHITSVSDKLFRFARSILKNEHNAMDAVQELSLKLWEKRNTLDAVDNFQAFTMRAMRNHCLDIIRLSKNTEALHEGILENDPDPFDRVEQSDANRYVLNLIDKLPALQRTIIQLRDVEEMEISEIASITSITENAVCVNLSRARQKIREQLLKEQHKVTTHTWTE